MTENLRNENGAKLSPQYFHDRLNSSNDCSSYSSSWELALRGGEQLAQYYLELVKMHLHSRNVPVDIRNQLITEAQRDREHLEIEEYGQKFLKRR